MQSSPVRREQFVLGTVCQISFYDSVDEETINAGFNELARIESLLSRKIPESDIGILNRAAQSSIEFIPLLSSETVDLIKRSLEYAEQTKGLFNPAIGPLVDLWGIGTEGARLPSLQEIEAILPLLNWMDTDVRDNNRIVLKKGMSLDLGGIAKGYAADRVKNILIEGGVDSAIINLGGNVLLIGRKPNGDLWKIGLQNPLSSRGEYVGILSLEDMSMVTSGNYERYFEQDGIRYHHIMDSKNGYPVENNLASVTIITALSTDADALSTSLYSMGLEKGMAFAEEQKNFEAIFLTKDNILYMTSGTEDFFQMTNGDFTVSSLPQ